MHLPRDYNLKVLPLDRQTIPKRALKIEEAALSGVPFMAVINFEVIWREPMLSTLSGITWDLVVVDESHRIARHSTKSGKALWNKIGPKSKHRVCLSGTVLSNGPVDAFGQTLFADPSLFGESFMRFRSRFCVMGGFEGKEILGYQNVDQFRETLGQITHRVRIDDILELPPMVDEQIQIDLPKKTMAVYETLKNEFVAELTDGTVVADNILVKLLRLQQITSGYCPTEDPETGRERIEVLDSEKIDAFTDKMKEIDPREPVVVFVRFVYDIENIMKACADIDRPCYRISGGYDEMEQWEEDSDLGLTCGRRADPVRGRGARFHKSALLLYVLDRVLPARVCSGERSDQEARPKGRILLFLPNGRQRHRRPVCLRRYREKAKGGRLGCGNAKTRFTRSWRL